MSWQLPLYKRTNNLSIIQRSIFYKKIEQKGGFVSRPTIREKNNKRTLLLGHFKRRVSLSLSLSLSLSFFFKKHTKIQSYHFSITLFLYRSITYGKQGVPSLDSFSKPNIPERGSLGTTWKVSWPFWSKKRPGNEPKNEWSQWKRLQQQHHFLWNKNWIMTAWPCSITHGDWKMCRHISPTGVEAKWLFAWR